jgi:anti-sigma factor RsiW
MSSRAITCRELVQLVSDYIEGALEHADRARFEAHLELCDGCSAYVDQMRKTIAMVGGLREDDIPAPAKDSLLAAFRDWRANSPKQS